MQPQREPTAPTADEIAAHLEEILASDEFAGSERRRTLLRFLVEETLADRGDSLKAYTIGRRALLRDEGFDPQADPIVRVEIGRLRATLDRYYRAHRDVAVVISIPRGRYRAEARRNTERPSRTADTQADRHVAVGPFRLLGEATDDLGTMLADTIAAVCRRAATSYRFDTVSPDVESGNRNEGGLRLGGSVRQIAGRVRVSAELTHRAAADPLWVRDVELQVADLHPFQVTDELAHRLAWALADDFGILPRLARRQRFAETANGRPQEVADSYLDAFEIVQTDRQRATRAGLETLTSSTPDDPRALAALSDALFTAWWLHLDPPNGALERAEDLAHRAVAGAPHLAEAHLSLAYVHSAHRRSRLMRLELERAEQLSGGSPHALVSAGLLICVDGDPGTGSELTRRAVELNPELPAWWRVVPTVAALDHDDLEAALAESVQIGEAAAFVGPLLRLVLRTRLGHPGAERDAKALLEFDDDVADRLPVMVDRVFHDTRIASLLVDTALASGMLPGGAA